MEEFRVDPRVTTPEARAIYIGGRRNDCGERATYQQ